MALERLSIAYYRKIAPALTDAEIRMALALTNDDTTISDRACWLLRFLAAWKRDELVEAYYQDLHGVCGTFTQKIQKMI